MNHLKWMGHSATIFEIQKTLRNDPGSCEVTLVGSNATVRAHRFVLSSCSELLRAALRDVPMDQEATIVVPDIRGALLDSVLAFIYMGETNITSTNLSEFLEAINTLGIRSAISFECNTTAALTTPQSAQAMPNEAIPIKTITGIQIAAHDEIMDPSQIGQKIELPHRQSQNMLTETSTARELDFLDVYGSEQQQPKITYSIGHMPVAAAGNEFILTETAGTFTLTQNPKLDGADTNDCEKIVETEDDDVDEAQNIMDDYSSGGEQPIMEISNSAVEAESAVINPAPSQIVQVAQVVKTTRRKGGRSKANRLQHLKSDGGGSLGEFNSTANATTATPTTTEQIPIIKLDAYSVNTATAGSSYEEHSGGIEHTLDMAVQAVINEGMSLQKAAVKFDLSKTVLWRRVRKHPDYMKTNRENPILSVACERLKSGDSLKTISRDLDIPMSTLHRHKVRLAQQGRLPDYITFRKRDAVTKDELKRKLLKAVHACVHEGMSQNHAANMFEIPKSTLWRHLQKRVAEAELVEGIDADDIKEEVILS